MTAVLTAESGDVDKISDTIKECKRSGFQVLPPSINESFSDFTIVRKEDGTVTNKIRFGLRSIKNFGEEIGKAIIHERKERGKFKSITDFLDRVTHRNLNKKSLEALIKCGAMDAYGERGQLLFNMENLLAYNKEATSHDQNQESLFGTMDEVSLPAFQLKEGSPATKEDKLTWEKELLGLYISGHPLDKIKDELEKREINIKKVQESFQDGMLVTLAGIIEASKTIITKRNEQMAFIKIADLSSSIEAVVFPRIFKEASDLFEKEKCIILKGRVSLRNGEKSIIIEYNLLEKVVK